MTNRTEPIKIAWSGPFSWPGFEEDNSLPPIPKVAGVYLQTFEYQGGYLIYAAGLTRRPIPVRFKEHSRKYKKGEYNVLDVDAARQGVRKEIWHGWGYARDHQEEFGTRKLQILNAVGNQLTEFRVFIADIGREPRILERLEASIMENLYQQPSPICNIPDKGMQLAPRRKSENKIVIMNHGTSVLHGFPHYLEI